MSVIRGHTATHRLSSTEAVSRRKSTRTRRIPGQWWKGGADLPVSKPQNAIKIRSSTLPNNIQRCAKRGVSNTSIFKGLELLKKDIPRPSLSGNKSIVDDEDRHGTINSRKTQKCQGTSQRRFLNAKEQLLSNKMAISSGETSLSRTADAGNDAFDLEGHCKVSSSATNRNEQTIVRVPGETGNRLTDKYKIIGGKHITESRVEQNNSTLGRTSSIQVSSGLCSAPNDLNIFNGNLLRDASSSSRPNSDVTKASGVVMSEEVLSRHHATRKLTPESGSISHNSAHEVKTYGESRAPDSFLKEKEIDDKSGQSFTAEPQRVSDDEGIKAGTVTHEIPSSSRPSPKIDCLNRNTDFDQFEEPGPVNVVEQCIDDKVYDSSSVQTSKGCSNCRLQVCTCQRRLYHQHEGTVAAPSVVSFKVRRGSKIHYMTENVSGEIKFGIRTCSDGILVGELTLYPQSATGPRRTGGRREWYILLRGFLILEVEESTIHLRQGDEVEFEEDTVFQMRNPCLQSTDLLCFLFSPE
ncbi:unnamed protein product [Agarophyton chilense]